jgi:ornithine carbamoyltransferase
MNKNVKKVVDFVSAPVTACVQRCLCAASVQTRWTWAASVIFVHNHPSGYLQPSDVNLRIHEQLTQAANILGLRILDHIIISRRGHLSFQEMGLIKS